MTAHATTAAISLVLSLGLAACGEDGMSSREMEQAAIDRARQELKLAADVPLEATVWTGKPVDGEVTYCGTVSSPKHSAVPVVPQRFAALSDPLRFELFEPAHEQIVQSRPDMFRSWAELCAGQQPA